MSVSISRSHDPVVIVSAARTPIGGLLGDFAALPAAELGGVAIRAAIERAGLPGDVVDEVTSFVTDVAQTASAAGADPVWIDPGIGFGKSTEHNLELLRRLPELCTCGFPVLLGVSRKTVIGRVTSREVVDRLAGSLAVIAPAWAAGVDVIRVHDVVETLDTITMLQAIWG